MIESQEVSGRKRRSREEIQRLMMEFESSGLQKNEFCRERLGRRDNLDASRKSK
jgi:hypothetical protein